MQDPRLSSLKIALDPDTPSSKDQLRALGHKAKVRTKKILNLDDSDHEDRKRTSYEAAVEELEESPAFSSSKFLNKSRIGPAGIPDKVIAVAQGAAGAVAHPKAAIKSRATRKTAGKLAKSRPYLSRQADLDFLEAQDDLERARNTRDSNDDDDTAAQREADIAGCAEHIEELERKKMNMKVAWVTARHVQRVRVVDSIPPPPFPSDSFFEQEDDCGFLEFNWGKWIAYKLLHSSHQFSAQYIDDFEELPFDLDTLRRHVERLIIVSAPVQTFITEIRDIYTWKSPGRTGLWLVSYFFLWYISHNMTFVYGYVCYTTVMNYYYPASTKDLRAAIERSVNRGATALKAGELMDRHGSHDWLEPLLEELGPFIQIQVADLANMLEAFYNFYHFQSHRATVSSLILIGTFFVVSAFCDARFALRLFWFVLGLVFFGCWPIASLYPRYRLLVSPVKWALWDVPTHAEWCFAYLQERSDIARKAILSAPSYDDYIRTEKELNASTSSPTNTHNLMDSDDSFESANSVALNEETAILSFRCTYLHVPGRFVISSKSICFTSSIPLPHESFNKPYHDLVEMSKQQTRSSILNPLAKITTGMDKLELWFRGEDGGAGLHGMGENDNAQKVVLENMKERDKAFNAVIGFSGVRWQNLQKRGVGKNMGKAM